jgi:mannose-1-phosphate guanylyltransferase
MGRCALTNKVRQLVYGALWPASRDSAAAIAAASELAMKKDSAAILLVVAADHLIPNIGEFTAACRARLEDSITVLPRVEIAVTFMRQSCNRAVSDSSHPHATDQVAVVHILSVGVADV